MLKFITFLFMIFMLTNCSIAPKDKWLTENKIYHKNEQKHRIQHDRAMKSMKSLEKKKLIKDPVTGNPRLDIPTLPY